MPLKGVNRGVGSFWTRWPMVEGSAMGLGRERTKKDEKTLV